MSPGDEAYREGGVETEVVRLGGSLLLPEDPSDSSLSDLRTRLRCWTKSRPTCRIWIVGTGAWGDHLRRVQEPLGLSDEVCHWAAIGLMSAASEIAAALIDGIDIVRDIDDLRRRIGGRTGPGDILFDPSRFLRETEPTMPGPALPCDWSVTSDSIAARVAASVAADALTLLKSCPAPKRRDMHAWSDQGLVDEFFPQVASDRMELRWVDFSSNPTTERRYPPS